MTENPFNPDNFRLGTNFLEILYLDYDEQNEKEYDYIERNLRLYLQDYWVSISSSYNSSLNINEYRISFKSCIEKFKILVKYSNFYIGLTIMLFKYKYTFKEDLLTKYNYHTRSGGYDNYIFNNNDINLTLLKIKYPDCIVIS